MQDSLFQDLKEFERAKHYYNHDGFYFPSVFTGERDCSLPSPVCHSQHSTALCTTARDIAYILTFGQEPCHGLAHHARSVVLARLQGLCLPTVDRGMCECVCCVWITPYGPPLLLPRRRHLALEKDRKTNFHRAGDIKKTRRSLTQSRIVVSALGSLFIVWPTTIIWPDIDRLTWGWSEGFIGHDNTVLVQG